MKVATLIIANYVFIVSQMSFGYWCIHTKKVSFLKRWRPLIVVIFLTSCVVQVAMQVALVFGWVPQTF